MIQTILFTFKEPTHTKDMWTALRSQFVNSGPVKLCGFNLSLVQLRFLAGAHKSYIICQTTDQKLPVATTNHYVVGAQAQPVSGSVDEVYNQCKPKPALELVQKDDQAA